MLTNAANYLFFQKHKGVPAWLFFFSEKTSVLQMHVFFFSVLMSAFLACDLMKD